MKNNPLYTLYFFCNFFNKYLFVLIFLLPLYIEKNNPLRIYIIYYHYPMYNTFYICLANTIFYFFLIHSNYFYHYLYLFYQLDFIKHELLEIYEPYNNI